MRNYLDFQQQQKIQVKFKVVKNTSIPGDLGDFWWNLIWEDVVGRNHKIRSPSSLQRGLTALNASGRPCTQPPKACEIGEHLLGVCACGWPCACYAWVTRMETDHLPSTLVKVCFKRKSQFTHSLLKHNRMCDQVAIAVENNIPQCVCVGGSYHRSKQWGGQELN